MGQKRCCCCLPVGLTYSVFLLVFVVLMFLCPSQSRLLLVLRFFLFLYIRLFRVFNVITRIVYMCFLTLSRSLLNWLVSSRIFLFSSALGTYHTCSHYRIITFSHILVCFPFDSSNVLLGLGSSYIISVPLLCVCPTHDPSVLCDFRKINDPPCLF